MWTRRESDAQKISPPELIVTANIQLISVTIPEVRDDMQLTLLATISAFRDFIRPLFISNSRRWRKRFLPLKSCTQVMIM
jgi:hypothetical protein